MWYTIFKFEIAYRSKRLDTYFFFVLLFLCAIVGTDFIYQGVHLGMVKQNAPLIIAKVMGVITGVFMFLTSMIMGVPILRDFEYNIEALLFVNPIKKRDYLLGRFLGSFAVLLFVFSGMVFGMMVGEFMPWHDAKDYLDFNFLAYLKAFVTVSLPILFVGASVFFVTGALSKNLIVVYTQGILFFVLFIAAKSISDDFLRAVIDPFSLSTISHLTDTWSTIEKNTLVLPFNNVLLYNKICWVLIGVFALLFGYKKFNFSVVNSKKKNKTTPILQLKIPQNICIPKVKIQNGILSKWNQIRQLSWFHFIGICKQPSFWTIVICGMLIIFINAISLGTVYGVDSYPATYFIVEELQEMSMYFFVIILIFYSSELIWKERAAKLDLMCDATPVSSFIVLLGKYFGLLLIYIVLILALIASGIIFQTLSGYYNYEFHVYFYGFFVEILPFLGLYTIVAFFMQAISSHKFMGILLLFVFLFAISALKIFGLDHDLYVFGGSKIGTYSAMNGYSHLLRPYLFIKTYWILFGILLFVVASLFMVRGTETRFLNRATAIKNRMSSSLLKFTVITGVLFIGLGSYIFYNTNVINIHYSNAYGNQFRIDYEKTLKKFEYLPQPKITEKNLKVELYPSERNYTSEGYYMLKNTTDTAINEIHIQKQISDDVAFEYVTFDGGAQVNNQYKKYHYSIYTLKQALQPNAQLKMRFKQTYITKGFKASRSRKNIVENGTFLKNTDFPTLGYNRKYEQPDPEERAENNLPKRLHKARREDLKELVNARNTSDADALNFEITIGTSGDQTAVAPGKLVKEWTSNERSYFQYKMNQKMIDFYAIVSARYAIKKDRWQSELAEQPVNLEIYHHKEHDYNIDRMMASMKASLSYCSRNYSPYQYTDLRIMEFPRYADFAQSFPGTIPFSESIGFMLDIDDEKDADMVFFITAHEVAHQWFGMQLEAANVQGQYFVLETLAQYAALMIFKQKYSEEDVQKLLVFEKNRYKKGNRENSNKEPSLALVQNEDYIYYSKGIINMYNLQKMIGEDKVNLAISNFLSDWNTNNGTLKTTSDRYATSKDLLGYFRTVTPKNKQHIITALFESVTELKIN